VLEPLNRTTDYLDDITKPLAQNPPIPAETKGDE
jgi:hypothetical protein